jgi:hypothetical protein
MVYSSIVVAPNGLEMFAALAFWTSLVALLRGVPKNRFGYVLALWTVSGALLTTTRSFGPLWCLLAGITTLVAVWPQRDGVVALLRRRSVWIAGLLVTATAVQSTVWVLTMGSLNIGGTPDRTYDLGERLHFLSREVVLWILQAIAAFPLRNEPTEPVVYASYLVLFIGLVTAGVVAARGRLRIGILTACFMSVLVPFLICLATFDANAGLWQGRYGLPYSLGIPVLATLALDRLQPRGISQRLRFVGSIVFVIAQATGPVAVMRKSLAHPLSDAASWIHPPWFVVGVLAGAGAGVYWWAATTVAGGLAPTADPTLPAGPLVGTKPEQSAS